MSRLQRDSSVSQPFCQAVGPGRSGLTGLATAVGSVALGSAGFVLPTAALEAGMNTRPSTAAQTAQHDQSSLQRQSLRNSGNSLTSPAQSMLQSVRTTTTADNRLAPAASAVPLATNVSSKVKPQNDATKEAREFNAHLLDMRKNLREWASIEERDGFPEVDILVAAVGHKKAAEFFRGRAVIASATAALPASMGRKRDERPVLQYGDMKEPAIFEKIIGDPKLRMEAVQVQPQLFREFIDHSVRQSESQLHRMVLRMRSLPTNVTPRNLAFFYRDNAAELLRGLGMMSLPKKHYKMYEQLKTEIPRYFNTILDASIQALEKAISFPDVVQEGVRLSLHNVAESLRSYRKVSDQLMADYFAVEDGKEGTAEEWVHDAQLKVVQKHAAKLFGAPRPKRELINWSLTPSSFVDMCKRISAAAESINTSFAPAKRVTHEVDGFMKHLLSVFKQLRTIPKWSFGANLNDAVLSDRVNCAHALQGMIRELMKNKETLPSTVVAPMLHEIILAHERLFTPEEMQNKKPYRNLYLGLLHGYSQTDLWDKLDKPALPSLRNVIQKVVDTVVTAYATLQQPKLPGARKQTSELSSVQTSEPSSVQTSEPSSMQTSKKSEKIFETMLPAVLKQPSSDALEMAQKIMNQAAELKLDSLKLDWLVGYSLEKGHDVDEARILANEFQRVATEVQDIIKSKGVGSVPKTLLDKLEELKPEEVLEQPLENVEQLSNKLSGCHSPLSYVNSEFGFAPVASRLAVGLPESKIVELEEQAMLEQKDGQEDRQKSKEGGGFTVIYESVTPKAKPTKTKNNTKGTMKRMAGSKKQSKKAQKEAQKKAQTITSTNSIGTLKSSSVGPQTLGGTKQ